MSALNRQRWVKLWQTATDMDPPADSYDRLVAMYSESHRHYHNLQHIGDCLHEFDAARQLTREPLAVELAIWFHDAVYDPRAADNEERSAALAKDWLMKDGATAIMAVSVGQLILATKNHDARLHSDAPLLVDVDLSILGQPSERFWEYERQIREEYAWVAPGVFGTKRTEILQKFLARPRIYHTEMFFRKLEVQARINLGASIRQLRG